MATVSSVLHNDELRNKVLSGKSTKKQLSCTQFLNTIHLTIQKELWSLNDINTVSFNTCETMSF